MKKIRRIWKILLVFFAAAMIPLVLGGCSKNDEKPADDQASKTEHPAGSEHPAGEHPK